MLTKRIELYAASDDTDSEENLGLVIYGMDIEGKSLMAARSGNLLAHDMLEHLDGPENIGCPYDEMMALGVLWFVRGHDWHMGNPEGKYVASPPDRLAWDICTLWEDLNEAEEIDRWDGPEPDCDAIEEIEGIIERAKSKIIREEDYAHHYDNFFAAVRSRMVEGYNKAQEVYGDRIYALELYQEVARVGSDLIGSIKYCNEGQPFAIIIEGRSVTGVDYEGEDEEIWNEEIEDAA